MAARLLSNIEPVLEIESPIKEKESQLSINSPDPKRDAEPKKETKEENKPSPNRLVNRPGYKDHLIDDLLGFGRPKRQ